MSEINKAIGILTEMTEKSPGTLYMGIYSTHEANEAIRLALSELTRLREQVAIYREVAVQEGWSHNLARAYERADYQAQREAHVDMRADVIRRAATLSRQSKEGGE